MAARGRKPTPPELKILRATRADRRPTSPAKLPKGRPTAPKELDKHGKEAWARLVPQLERLGVLTEVDGELLALYCDAYSRLRAAQGAIKKHGPLVKTGLGSEKANPAITIAAVASAQMARLLAEFGLTPSARSRLFSHNAGPKDELGEFLAKRKV